MGNIIALIWLFASPTSAALLDRSYSMPECGSLGSGDQSCYWTLKVDKDLCRNRRCSKLVIFFSGGQMTCPGPGANGTYMADFAQAGYVAACVRLYQDSNGSSEYPYNQEDSRADALVHAVTTSPDVAKFWTGENLLLSGVSHGATAPVAAMANTNVEDAPHWQGTRNTAACFIDGIYDIPALFNFLRGNSCAEANSTLSYQRAYSRYCNWSGGFNSRTWPASSQCNTTDVYRDTSTRADTTAFSIENWKLIECGSAMNPCSDDVAPATPIQVLCKGLNDSIDHKCAFQQFPSISHINCGVELEPSRACRSWFDGVVKAN